MPLAVLWHVTVPWYGDRLDPASRRRSPADHQAMLAGAGLTDDFWRLTEPAG